MTTTSDARKRFAEAVRTERPTLLEPDDLPMITLLSDVCLIQPGDHVFIPFDEPLTVEHAELIKGHLRERFTDQVEWGLIAPSSLVVPIVFRPSTPLEPDDLGTPIFDALAAES